MVLLSWVRTVSSKDCRGERGCWSVEHRVLSLHTHTNKNHIASFGGNWKTSCWVVRADDRFRVRYLHFRISRI